MFLPSGTPIQIAFLLVLIELVSYIARLFSLSIRLFANMMAGHTLLKILIGFSFSILFSFSALIPFAIIP
jgi:F-type H+-transporting ATPase subunit a